MKFDSVTQNNLTETKWVSGFALAQPPRLQACFPGLSTTLSVPMALCVCGCHFNRLSSYIHTVSSEPSYLLHLFLVPEPATHHKIVLPVLPG